MENSEGNASPSQVPDITGLTFNDLNLPSLDSNDAPSPEPASNRRGRRFIFMSIIGILFVLIIAGGTAAYVYYREPTPEEALMRMLESYQEIKYSRMKGEIEMRVPLNTEEMPFMSTDEISHEVFAKFMFESSTDRSDANNIKSDGNMDMVMGLDDEDMLSLGGGMVLVEEAFYIQLKKLKLHGFGAMLLAAVPLDLKAVENFWMKIDEAALAEAGGNSDEWTKMFAQQSAENTERWIKIIREHQPLEITKNFGTEDLHGVRTLHFAFNVHTDALEELMKSEEEMLTEEAFDDVLSAVKNMHATGEIWIDRKDFYLRKITMDIGVHPDFFAEHGITENGKIHIALEGVSFNEPLDIQVPTNILTVNEYTEKLFGVKGGPVGQARMKARDTQRIGDIKEIQLGLELYADSANGIYPASLNALVPTYIDSIPLDPVTNTPPTYKRSTSKKQYVVATKLEGDSGALREDRDGKILSVDCADPVYCATQ